ncbi:MAG: multidrug efflux SMR transporter [Comamonadaceae bacterium]|nr:multidrug efflux SMR transporter [Comamonadaceae bacterium]
MKSHLFLLGAILSEVAATSALKASENFTRPGPTAIVVAGYALAFWLLSFTLRTMPVGLAYAIWSGLGMALIAVAGWLLYGQRLDAWAWLGLALIIAGVLVLQLLSKSAAH